MALVTKSIGTDARDYATITLWEAALGGAAGGGGNDALGECYADSDFDETLTIADGTPDTTTLSVEAGERHDGTAGSGAVIVRTGASCLGLQGNIVRTLEWLEIDMNSQAVADTGAVWTNGTNINVQTFKNLILHNGVNSGTFDSYGIFVAKGLPTDVLNCIFYDIEQTNVGNYNSYGIGIESPPGQAMRLLNNTVHDIEQDGSGDSFCYKFDDDADVIIKNCIGTDPDNGSTSGTEQCYEQAAPGNATVDYNLASDASASGGNSLDSKASANQYVSTAGGSEDLHLKTGADAIDVGVDLVTTPTGVNIDINGRDRDAEADTWDMGAHEFVGAPPAGWAHDFNGVANANIGSINGIALANIGAVNGIA